MIDLTAHPRSQTPSVSVVLPVYEGARYLRASIESVLGQSCTDFEFIIFDDGSRDSSLEIIRSYPDSRIKVFENEKNLGLFPTLNRAIAQSSAPLVRLWSQDDIMKSSCLERELAFLAQHESVAMAYCAYDTIDQNGKVTLPAKADATPEVIAPAVAAQIMFYHGSLTGNIANVTIRRSALDQVGLFCEDMIVSGDFEMWVRLSERSPVGFLNEALILLRSHDGQFSRKDGIYLQCMREDREIVRILADRLPEEIRKYARRYDLCEREVQHVHYLVRCLVQRRWHRALQTYRETARSSPVGLLLVVWLLTGNRRVLKMKPRYAPAVR